MNCPNCRCYIAKETLKCPYCGYSFFTNRTAVRTQTAAYSTYPLDADGQNQQYGYTGQGAATQIYYRGGAANNGSAGFDQYADRNVRDERRAAPNSQRRKINLRVLIPLGLMRVALQTLILLLQIIILCK